MGFKPSDTQDYILVGRTSNQISSAVVEKMYKTRLSNAEKMTPEALADALAVASRLSATEMRELHAVLLKGGDDVAPPKSKIAKKKKGTKAKKKGLKKKKAPKNTGFAFQAWPDPTSDAASSTSTSNPKAPTSGRKLISEEGKAPPATVRVSNIGFHHEGATVAVADSFAREAFGDTLYQEEKEAESSTNSEAADPVPFPQTLRQESELVRKRRKFKKRKMKVASQTLMPWDPSVVPKQESDPVATWSSAFGPMRYKLGKAKAAIHVYRSQIETHSKEKHHVSKRLSAEENEHDYTRMKLLGQEYLFVKCLEMVKKLEMVGRAEKMGMAEADRAAYAGLNAEEEVRTSLKTAISGGSIKDIVKSAESVAKDVVGALEKHIASKDADIIAAKRAYDELNKRLDHAAKENANLTNLLSQMTGTTRDLEDRLETVMNDKDALHTEIAGLKTQMGRMHEENGTLRKALAGQSKEVEKYVDTLVEHIRKRFGYVPPQLKLTAFFGAPSFAHLSKEFWREP